MTKPSLPVRFLPIVALALTAALPLSDCGGSTTELESTKCELRRVSYERDELKHRLDLTLARLYDLHARFDRFRSTLGIPERHRDDHKTTSARPRANSPVEVAR
jgi:hypothetical protein